MKKTLAALTLSLVAFTAAPAHAETPPRPLDPGAVLVTHTVRHELDFYVRADADAATRYTWTWNGGVMNSQMLDAGTESGLHVINHVGVRLTYRLYKNGHRVGVWHLR